MASVPSAPPTLSVPTPKPTIEECDYILGHYLRAWDQLQMAQLELFTKLLDMNPQAAHCIFHAQSTVKTQREIIVALGAQRLTKVDQARLVPLQKSVGTLATKRNRIVHGSWMLSIRIHRDKKGVERARTATWLRAYQPPDLSLIHQMQRDPKLAQRYQYSTRQLISAAQQNRALVTRIRAFTKPLTLTPYVPPTPLPIS